LQPIPLAEERVRETVLCNLRSANLPSRMRKWDIESNRKFAHLGVASVVSSGTKVQNLRYLLEQSKIDREGTCKIDWNSKIESGSRARKEICCESALY